MRGHVRRRGTRWVAIIEVPTTNGKRRQKWLSGFETKKAAERAMAEALVKIDKGIFVEASKQTLSEYFDTWLKAMRGQVKESTLRSYEVIVNKRIRPHLGALTLHRLTRSHLEAFYTDLLEEGLAPSSVSHTHAVLSRALRDAVDQHLIARNPAYGARKPKVPIRQVQTWSAREVSRFLASVKHDRLSALYLVAVTTGMRRGEVVALRWRDVDLEAGRATILQSYVRSGAGWQFTEPKTKASRRTVALDTHTLSALRGHRARQVLERTLMGDAYEENDLIFAREDGAPVEPRYVAERFEVFLKAAKLPRIRFHDLRHTHATLALQAGVHPKVVQERLGHSDISITLQTYSHVLPGMQEEAAEQVAALLFGS